MADFKNYDPALIAVTFKGVLVQGYADGTFVKAERNEDTFETSTGASGDVTRVRKRNRTGLVTLTLKAESPTNDSLSALHTQDELFGTGVGALMIKDLNGTTIAEATSAWIRKPASPEYADTATMREWLIECAELFLHTGGATS